MFAFNVKQVNSSARLIFVNGITGQGTFMLSKYLRQARDILTLKDLKLRFTTPAAVCSYCTGNENREKYQMGMLKNWSLRAYEYCRFNNLFKEYKPGRILKDYPIAGDFLANFRLKPFQSTTIAPGP